MGGGQAGLMSANFRIEVNERACKTKISKKRITHSSAPFFYPEGFKLRNMNSLNLYVKLVLPLNHKIPKKQRLQRFLRLFTAAYSHVSLERSQLRTSPELLACARDDRSVETRVSTALRTERLKANLS